MADRLQRYVFLDGLRGLAAVSIVVHHFTTDTGHGEVFASASIAVDFFFCLSGFVIAHAYHDRLLGGMGLLDYAAKRLSRLYPMYFIGTLLGIVAVALLRQAGLSSLTYEKIATAAALNLFYVPYLNSEYVDVFVVRLQGTLFPLDNPAWSLFFGMVANLLYALALRVWRNAPMALAAAAAVGLCFAMALYGEAPGWGARNIIGGLPRVMFTFFAGVVIFQFHDATRSLPRLSGAVIVAIIVVVVAIPRFPVHKFYWLVMVLAVVPLLVAMGSWVKVDERSRWHRLCSYSGRISYPIFCLHYPLLMLFSLLPRDEGRMELFSLTFLGFLALAGSYLFITILVAHFLMKRVEEPVRAWLGVLRQRRAGSNPTL